MIYEARNSLLWCCLLIQLHLICCFNLDYEYTILKNGPANSLFGFTVAEHKDPTANTWLLVGAPQANSTFVSYAKTPGAVFKCDANDIKKECDELKFDQTGKSEYTSKDDQFFGVSLKSGGGNDKHIMACAHRAKYFGSLKSFILHEGNCFVLFDDFTYNINVQPCRAQPGTPNYDNYGQCLAGTSLNIHHEKKETFHLLGAPGSKQGSGVVFSYDFELDSLKQTSENLLQDSGNSYFGYATTHGHFYDKDSITVATSGPRFDSVGKVLLFTKDLGNLKQELPAKEDKVQIASGYGVSLCSIDVDGDGIEELIVGAPYHSNDASYGNQGLVYIYAKDAKNKMVLIRTIDASSYGTDNGKGAYFGLAVENAGDLNFDGFNDLIIGAPHDNKGQGAVYIFQGSSEGLSKKPSQIVRASTLQNGLDDSLGLQGFGRSFGTGVDTDKNGYKDILIGAYTSSQAILLRSRPVIDAHISVSFTPKELQVTGDCDSRGIKTTCFDMEFCFNFTEPSGQVYTQPGQTVPIKYTIVADPIKRPRVRFASGLVRHEMIEETSRNKKCTTLKKLYLVYNDEDEIPEFPDITFEIEYSLPYDDGELDKPQRTDTQLVSLEQYPVLKQTYVNREPMEMQHKLEVQLKFKRECSVCIPDLKIISEKNFTFGLGQETFTFFASVKNDGADPAYTVSLMFNFSKGLSLDTLTANDKSAICNKNTCEGMHNKLSPGQELELKITLSTINFKPTSDPLFNITVFSVNEEDDKTTEDNSVSVTLELKVEADVQVLTKKELYKTLTSKISGKSTLQVVYSGKAVGETAMKKLGDIGDRVDHKYIVLNKGPDLLPTAQLTINWPIETRNGKHLLYLVDVITTKSSIECEVPDKNILNLPGAGSTEANKYKARVRRSTNDTTPPPPTTSTMVSNTSQTTPSVVQTTPSVGQTTPSGEKTTPGNQQTTPPSTEQTTTPSTEEEKRKKDGIILDCSNSQCIDIVCRFFDLPSGEPQSITVRSRLWQSSLVLDYYGDVLTVVSSAKVDTGTNLTYIVDPNPNNNKKEEKGTPQDVDVKNQLFTVINPDFPPKKKEQKIWVYIIAALAGVLLLVLLIFGLYKLGFFKRKRYTSEYEPKKKLVN